MSELCCLDLWNLPKVSKSPVENGWEWRKASQEFSCATVVIPPTIIKIPAQFTPNWRSNTKPMLLRLGGKGVHRAFKPNLIPSGKICSPFAHYLLAVKWVFFCKIEPTPTKWVSRFKMTKLQVRWFWSPPFWDNLKTGISHVDLWIPSSLCGTRGSKFDSSFAKFGKVFVDLSRCGGRAPLELSQNRGCHAIPDLIAKSNWKWCCLHVFATGWQGGPIECLRQSSIWHWINSHWFFLTSLLGLSHESQKHDCDCLPMFMCQT